MKVKLSMQITAIIVLVFIVAIMGMILFLRENQHVYDLNKASSDYNYQQDRYLENMSIQTDNYNELYSDFNELNKNYQELAGSKGFYEGWEEYLCTGYTSLDQGCNSIASTGINIEKLSKLYNFCAVDPTLIEYGSIVLVKFEADIEPFLAVDCGGAIKGKHIDLYCVNDLSKAFKINETLEVKVIK